MSDRECWMNDLPPRGGDMTRYFKATRPDGRDFHTGAINYADALASGDPITHPSPGRDGAGGYLSVSVSPSDCTGMSWPCRLFEVEPDDPWVPGPGTLFNKRACHSLRVVRELPAHEALGPQGEHVAALIDRAGRLTVDEADRLVAARGATRRARGATWGGIWAAALGVARVGAWRAARDAAWAAAWDAALDAVWDEARGADWATQEATWAAARALVVRDLISADHYDTLTVAWRAAIGPIHPGDPDTTIPKETPST